MLGSYIGLVFKLYSREATLGIIANKNIFKQAKIKEKMERRFGVVMTLFSTAHHF